jgi:glyoxylase-like metal-dependent hydrolase (beta-lactamase superfamily II)
MIKEVFPNIFQTKIPLPRNPLRHLNAYLIKSAERVLLIDAGLNFPQAFEALRRGLSEAGVEMRRLTDVLFTHYHIDHVGMISRIKDVATGLNLWIHPAERELSRFMAKDFKEFLNATKDFLKASGAPSSYVDNPRDFLPAGFTLKAYEEIAESAHPLSDGQEIDVGGYHFQVLWTPGHSPGHVCLYEPSLKALISGDHVLPTITPHVSQFMADANPLEDYLESLERVERLDAKVVLPAHEEAFTNLRERVKQLKNHHEQRLKEILTLLENGSLTLHSLASKVHWNVSYKDWEHFPPIQKFLALGETLSHLTFLERKGLVKRTMVKQEILYEINEGSNATHRIT